MKRRGLIRHQESHGCEPLREGGNHTVYVNRPARKTSTVPRHSEINDILAFKICRDLQVPEPYTSRKKEEGCCPLVPSIRKATPVPFTD